MRFCSRVTVKLLVFLLLAVPVATQAASEEVEYRAMLLRLIDSLQQQIVLLRAELEARQAAAVQSTATEYEEGTLSGKVDVINSYQIEGDMAVSVIRDRQQRKYFERVFALFPEEYENRLGRVVIFADEDVLFDAFVETIPPDHETWLYAANEAILDDPTARWNEELMVHELAHIISYDSAPGTVGLSTETCESYFRQHGCPAAQAYLRKFVDEYWTAADLARAERFALRDDAYDAAYTYYDNHQDDFVSDYAAIGPEEDFAESFMFFVFDERVSGDVARSKVDFFERFADLVGVKFEIEAVVGE